ncbi:MAG: hypothetical protein KGN40_01145 [Burkholderiales bacterium]|nr:hypothetical protein [Burkholderiales bacterium]
MSPLVPAADREQLSRVRASLAQDGLDLAMIGRDRDQLSIYAAAVATVLAEQGGWHVEKLDPSRLETLLADLVLARFDGALQSLTEHAVTPRTRSPRAYLVFIPNAQDLSAAELRHLLRLMRGTGHSALRVVTLFTGSASSCEQKLSALGPKVARWYLDEAPGDEADDDLVLSAGERGASKPTASKHTASERAPSKRTSSKRAEQRHAHYRHRRTVGAGLITYGSLMLALMAGPALWPGADQLARLLPLPASSDTSSSLAGVPVFMPATANGNYEIKLPATGLPDSPISQTANDALYSGTDAAPSAQTAPATSTLGTTASSELSPTDSAKPAGVPDQ